MKKLLVSLLILVLCFSLCACRGKGKGTDADASLSEDEINSQYEKMMKENEEKLLDADYNPITDSFTQVDFQLTKTDDTTAFNLPENSFAKITTSCTNFSFFNKDLPSDSFEGNFKTAKGLSLENTVTEIISSYKMDWKNVMCKKDEGLYVEYNEEYDCQNISFAFKSDDGMEFSLVGAKELLELLQIRDFSGSEYISESEIEKIVKGTNTVAIVDIVPLSDGNAQSIKISRFDKKTQE